MQIRKYIVSPVKQNQERHGSFLRDFFEKLLSQIDRHFLEIGIHVMHTVLGLIGVGLDFGMIRVQLRLVPRKSVQSVLLNAKTRF